MSLLPTQVIGVELHSDEFLRLFQTLVNNGSVSFSKELNSSTEKLNECIKSLNESNYFLTLNTKLLMKVWLTRSYTDHQKTDIILIGFELNHPKYNPFLFHFNLEMSHPTLEFLRQCQDSLKQVFPNKIPKLKIV